jgi:hypothetical protein
VPPKEISWRDEPHASLRPRWLNVWRKAALAALGTWNTAWVGILLVGSALELAGKKVTLFDGLRELLQYGKTVVFFRGLSLPHGLFSTLAWLLIPAVILVGDNVKRVDVKSMGLKRALLEQVWKPVKRIGSGSAGFIGGVVAFTWAVTSSTLHPSAASRSYLYTYVLLYLAPTYIDVFYFALGFPDRRGEELWGSVERVSSRTLRAAPPAQGRAQERREVMQRRCEE